MEKEKIIKSLKEWVYPILAPIIVAYITISILTPSPPILDVSTERYYQVSPEIEGTLSILIKNPNNYEVDIYTIGYIFSWEDHNPLGINYALIKPATINSNEKDNEKFREPSVITLGSSGFESNSILEEPKIKTPSEGNHILTIVIDTNKGIVTKDIPIIVIKKS